MHYFKNALFILFAIGILSCGDDEKAEPPVCGEFGDINSLQFVIDEEVDDDLFEWPVGMDSITVDGLPDGVVFGEFWARLMGTPTEAGEFTLTINAVPADARCPVPETITKTLIVEDKPVECDEAIDCGIVIFPSNTSCTVHSMCNATDRCFAVTPSYGICDSPNSICGRGMLEVLYPLAYGGEDTICIRENYGDYICNERGHCIYEG